MIDSRLARHFVAHLHEKIDIRKRRQQAEQQAMSDMTSPGDHILAMSSVVHDVDNGEIEESWHSGVYISDSKIIDFTDKGVFHRSFEDLRLLSGIQPVLSSNTR